MEEENIRTSWEVDLDTHPLVGGSQMSKSEILHVMGTQPVPD